jgi:hypothetical protein
MKTIIVQRVINGKPADIKLTLEDASPENVALIIEHIRRMEGGE